VRHLAQANIARMRARLDSPVMDEFVAALDPVNRIAEHSPGFVWRLRSSESHGATTLWDGSAPIILNLSVWESYEALHAFVYRRPTVDEALPPTRRRGPFEPDGQPARRHGRGSVRRSAG